MLDFAISFTFKLIILIMLLYILAYIIDLLYLELYIYPKILKEEAEQEKVIEDENIEIIDINVDDDLDKAVEEIMNKIKEMKKDDE